MLFYEIAITFVETKKSTVLIKDIKKSKILIHFYD